MRLQSDVLTLDSILLVRRVSQPSWSPDGCLIGFVVEHDGSAQICTIAAAGGWPMQITIDPAPLSDLVFSVRQYDWSPDGAHLVYAAEVERGAQLWVVPAGGGPARRIVGPPGFNHSPRWSPDGRHILFVTDREGCEQIALVGSAGGWPAPLTEEVCHAGDPRWSPDGRQIAYTWQETHDRRSQDIWLRALAGGPPRRLTESTGRRNHSPRWSPDGRYLAFISDRSGYDNVWIMPLAGGKARPLLPEAADQREITWSPGGRRLALVRIAAGNAQVVVVDIASGRVREVSPAGGYHVGPQWSPDGRQLVYVSSSYDRAPDLVVASFGRGSRRQLTFTMPAGMAGADWVQPEHLHYDAAGDVRVPALLYRPDEPLFGGPGPGLVWVHEGPSWQVYNDWHPFIQYLVHRGFTVIAPNYRGSTGYGTAFERLNDGDWGGSDVEDVVGAGALLRSLPAIDGSRIGVWGASYGGYLTLLSLGKHPDAFAAGVDLYGACDEALLWEQTDVAGRMAIESKMGVPFANREVYRRGAPLNYVGQIKAAVLILHGEDDQRVTIEQSEAMVEALSRRGKYVEFFRYPGEGHGFRHVKTLRHAFGQIERFLDRRLRKGWGLPPED